MTSLQNWQATNMDKFNGHRSWNAWSVAFWMGNDEPTYVFAMQCIKKAKNTLSNEHVLRKRGFWDAAVINRATNKFMAQHGGQKTPDGGIYNRLAVRLALEGLMG